MKPETRKAIADNNPPRRVRTVPSTWPLIAWAATWAFFAGGLVGWALFKELYRGR